MKITVKWLKKHNACSEGIDWFNNQSETDGIKIVKKLIKEKKYSWANWLVVRLMKHKQRIRYAVYSAELVLPIFEKRYPDNNRPRKAIEAAKKCIKYNSKKNRATAAADADAARAAFAAASAADAAADADAVAAAAFAAFAAASASVTYDANNDMKMKIKILIKILNYGIGLLE